MPTADLFWPGDRDPSPAVGRATVDGDVVRAAGEFDRANLDGLRAALEEVATRVPGAFVVDLTEVSYLDSSAIGVFWQYTERRPRFRVRADSVVARVLRRVGFADLELLDVESEAPG
jgi:anti-anti-sigma factor